MSVAFHPRVWLNSLIPPLSTLEREVLICAAKAADPRFRSIVEEQIAEINFVQRHANGRDVYLYRIDWGWRIGRRSRTLETPEREFAWLRVRISDTTSAHKSSATVAILNGRIANIVFRDDPRKLDGKQVSVSVIDQQSFDRSQSKSKAWLSLLPTDLMASAKSTQEAELVSFLPPEEAYEVVLPQGDFVVIGEFADIGNIVVSGSTSPGLQGILLAKYDGSAPERIGTTCAEARENLMRIST